MDRFTGSQSAYIPTFAAPTSANYTLAKIAHTNTTSNATLVAHGTNVYDVTVWVLDPGPQGERVKNMAGQDAERAGELWARLAGDEMTHYKVGTLVPEQAHAEEQEPRPESFSAPESFVPSRSGSPVTPPAAGSSAARYNQPQTNPNPPPGQGLSHLEYAHGLLCQRQRRLQNAQHNAQAAFAEVAAAKQLVREAEALRDGLVLMAMEGERPKWSASLP